MQNWASHFVVFYLLLFFRKKVTKKLVPKKTRLMTPSMVKWLSRIFELSITRTASCSDSFLAHAKL